MPNKEVFKCCYCQNDLVVEWRGLVEIVKCSNCKKEWMFDRWGACREATEYDKEVYGLLPYFDEPENIDML